MPELLAAASILVAIAGGVSLLLALPAVALAETLGESDAASRARTWLAALILPAVAGAIAAVWALSLQAQGLAASPHLGGQRPHLCLLPLLNAPAGAYRLRIFPWFALALVALGGLRLILGAFTSHLLRRLVLVSGAPLAQSRDGAAGAHLLRARADLLAVHLAAPTSFCAGLLRPVAVVSSALVGRLDPEHLQAVAAHELAHVRRRDNLAGLLADACMALLVFLPTTHYFRQQWRAASEAAADDAALGIGVHRQALCEALEQVERARQRRSPERPSLIALLIPPPATTTQRIRRLVAQGATAAWEEAACGDVLPQEGAWPDPHDTGLRRALPWVAFAVGVVAAALLVLVSRQSVEDSLYCAAEQITKAAR
jgi:Zn-dependent protease with chaperone function